MKRSILTARTASRGVAHLGIFLRLFARLDKKICESSPQAAYLTSNNKHLHRVSCSLCVQNISVQLRSNCGALRGQFSQLSMCHAGGQSAATQPENTETPIFFSVWYQEQKGLRNYYKHLNCDFQKLHSNGLTSKKSRRHFQTDIYVLQPFYIFRLLGALAFFSCDVIVEKFQRASLAI